MTKQLNYCEVFGNHFNYKYQVENNDVILIFQLRRLGIHIIGLASAMPTSWHWQSSMKITHRGYLVNGVDVEPHFGFSAPVGMGDG